MSPFFRTLPLERHGLRWLQSGVSVAHPLDDAPAVLLRRSLDDTARELGADADAYRRLLGPSLRDPHALLADLLAPLRIPRHPLRMARFGLPGLLPARVLYRACFREERARALLAGCAAHSILPFERLLTGAVGMIFALTGHVEDWPVAAGGSQAIGEALGSYLREVGGTIETGRLVRTLDDLPPARVVLFDTSPAQLAAVAGAVLPDGYLRRLGRFRYGPGVFKLDWALDGPIPWRDPRAVEAATVHVGGTLDEIADAEGAVARGEHPERPFVMVVQQSQLDPSRAPAGKQTGYAYIQRAGRIDRRSDRRDRAADRALRAGLPRPHPRAPRAAPGRPGARQPELPRRRDLRWVDGRDAVLHASGHAARPLLDAQPARLPVLRLDATRSGRARHVRLLRRA